MIKLSERLIQRYSAALQHVGDDFGVSTIPVGAKFFLCDCLQFEGGKILAYCVFVDDDFYYFSLNGLVYNCRRFFRIGFSFEEIAALFYLIFIEHETFNL